MNANASQCAPLLVVDDDEDIRDAISAVLEDAGYRVATAFDGKNAMEYLESSPAPCLVLLDLMMPVMNGWQVLEALEKNDRLSQIPVIVVTASHLAGGDAEKSLGIHVSRVLGKPVALDTLLELVESHCGARASVH